MKRLIIAGALLIGTAVSAYADNSTYIHVGKGSWTDAELQAAADRCDQQYGPVMNGTVTSAKYKSCMLKQGWRYDHTTRDRTAREQFFTDPDYPGELCKSFTIFGVTGEECSNMW